MKQFYPTAFCKINYSDVNLGHLQIGNPSFHYSLTRSKMIESPSIEINVNTDIDRKKIAAIFSGHETGYIDYVGDSYYRNCNVVSNFEKRSVLYNGKLPNSVLDISWEMKNQRILVNISVTKNYLFESRSRLTSNPPFESLLSGLIYQFAVYLGFVPFHAAAVYDEIKASSILFMGLPNTGKTTTATHFTNLNNLLMISEDIVFVDVKTMEVISAPFTFNPKNSDRFHAKQDFGYNLDTIIMLSSAKSPSSCNALSHEKLKEKIFDMNFYEFFWLDNLILRHLFCLDEEVSLGNISNLYIRHMEKIASKVKGLSLRGNDKENWAALLSSVVKSN